MSFINKVLKVSSFFTNIFCKKKTFEVPSDYNLIHSDDFSEIDFSYWKEYPYGYFKTGDLKVYWQSDKGMKVRNKTLELYVETDPKVWEIKSLPEYQRRELNYQEVDTPKPSKLYCIFNRHELVSTNQYDRISIPYVSGLLHSIKGYRYGIFKIEAMFPEGRNLWPSFWMSGIESWPPEIDIFEGYTKSDKIEPNVHYGDCNENHKATGASSISLSDKSTQWHEYVCWWEKDFIKIFYDGRLVYQITDKNVLKWFDNKTLKIILNCNIDYWESGRFDFVPTDEPLKFRNFKIYQK